ncbi:stage II sporulation protein M [Haloarcula sp. Atlit-120R]|uniref:stage II sporulation protein M n=1 Tax=Haloarcula sp. Atlit-120R TaxID=2282135 RepID=UPI000EF28DAD|nr:stage II sporulation protein M [Haloarcula sp. Atlit-120R]RLM33415.1 stage II sporulation protein M [Haloarcula sp. Atlit-120R]
MDDRPSLPARLFHRWLLRYVPAAALILFASALVGYGLGSQIPTEWLQTPGTTGENPFMPAELTTLSLTVNNLGALLVMLLGAISLGSMTVLSLVLNGLLIGVVVGIALKQVSPVVVAALIVPHGLIEIPALLIVAAVGLRFGWRTIQYIRGRTNELATRQDIREAGWLLATAAVFIVIAAYIEANLTIEIASRFTDADLSGIAPA